MKWQLLIVVMVSVAVVALARPASADTYVRTGSSDNPIRLIAYVVHPIGVLVEYTLLRPIHKLVSREPANAIFGHQTTVGDEFPGWKGRKSVHNPRAYTPIYGSDGKEDSEAVSGCCGAGEEASASCAAEEKPAQ